MGPATGAASSQAACGGVGAGEGESYSKAGGGPVSPPLGRAQQWGIQKPRAVCDLELSASEWEGGMVDAGSGLRKVDGDLGWNLIVRTGNQGVAGM